MAKYPVNCAGSVPRYAGSDPKNKNKFIEEWNIAKKIDEYLNSQAESSEFPNPNFPYFVIANDLGLSEKIVRDILFRYDGGSHQITVEKS